MPDHGSELAAPSPVNTETPRRKHTYGRLTTAVAVLALATAGYTLWRLDALHDRLDALRDATRTLEAHRAVLQAEINTLADRERQARRALGRRVDLLNDVPQQMQELAATLEELRGRAQGPERAWSRAEAMFLLELAQRRLTLDRDVDTATAALESADARLAALRDASLTGVRTQIARDLQALRAAPQPDVGGILARLASAEEQAMRAAVRGRVVNEGAAFDRDALPEGAFTRAAAIARRTLASLIVVRRVEGRDQTIVSAEEALLRRQHLQLLLFAARTAVERHDAAGYRSALASARQWLGDFFDLADPAAGSVLAEVQRLEPIDIDPALPDLSGSLRALQRLMPARRGPE